MSTDSFSTHSLSECNWPILCATKTIQAMNRLNEKNLGTAPDKPSMGDINDITASPQERTKSDTEQFRKFYGNAHYSLEDSATEPFPPHWRSDTKTNNLMPTGMQNSGSRIRWRINLKGKNLVKSGTNEEQY